MRRRAPHFPSPSSSSSVLLPPRETTDGSAAASAAAAAAEAVLASLDGGVASPRSPFRDAAATKPPPGDDDDAPLRLPLKSALSAGRGLLAHAARAAARSVRFDRGEDAATPPPSLPPRPLAPAGGSISLASAHFCPVCGVVATSPANLADHQRGRRHARRLAWLRGMPREEAVNELARTASGGVVGGGSADGGALYPADSFPCVRLGSIALPSSMDLREYLDAVQEVGSARASAAGGGAGGAASDDGGGETTTLTAAADAPGGGGLHECLVCGVSTTSGPHLDAHLAGRKHRRRADARAPAPGARRPPPHHCPACDVTTTSAEHLAMHLAGKAHARRLAVGRALDQEEDEGGAADDAATPTETIFHECADCGVRTDCAAAAAAHLAGEAHAAQAERLAAAAAAAAEPAPPAPRRASEGGAAGRARRRGTRGGGGGNGGAAAPAAHPGHHHHAAAHAYPSYAYGYYPAYGAAAAYAGLGAPAVFYPARAWNA